MELITYRKTLDVHKGGVQFTLRGFETADKISRVIEISLMASGDAIDFPLERLVAVMYVTTPSAAEPSINECTIVDNKIVYNVLPITEEGITSMKLKLIETGPEGARRVLATPKFEVEVIDSGISDDGPGVDATFEGNDTSDKIKPEFTALENFIAKADVAYGSRLERIELDSECVFKAYYADGTIYETDLLRKLFVNGNGSTLLAESFAKGGTGTRTGEDTDNSMYYSNVSKSEALTAKSIMENSEDILEQVRLHGTYTAFRVDFNSGEVEYVSPRYNFAINKDTGNLEATEQTYTFIEEIKAVVFDWFRDNGIALTDLQKISTTHTEQIEALDSRTTSAESDIDVLNTHASESDAKINGIDTSLSSLWEKFNVLDAFVREEKEILLWENANGTLGDVTLSNYAGAFNLVAYNSFKFICSGGHEQTFTGYGAFKITQHDKYREININVREDNISISICRLFNTVASTDARLVPLKIYGIKKMNLEEEN